MKREIISAYNNFIWADADDDLVGMTKAVVDFVVLLRSFLKNQDFPSYSAPNRYHKHQPHLISYETRIQVREVLMRVFKYQIDDNLDNLHIKNLISLVIAVAYTYHMPVNEIVKFSENGIEITRELTQQMLLADDMSPNWIKEPSDRDFSHLMI